MKSGTYFATHPAQALTLAAVLFLSACQSPAGRGTGALPPPTYPQQAIPQAQSQVATHPTATVIPPSYGQSWAYNGYYQPVSHVPISPVAVSQIPIVAETAPNTAPNYIPKEGSFRSEFLIPERIISLDTASVGHPESPQGQICALTFDDGPDVRFDPHILDVLARNGVRATFFLLGKKIEGKSALIRRMASEGHEIGNHSWDHANLSKLGANAISQQLANTNNRLEREGIRPRVFRPPYGAFNKRLLQQSRAQGLELVLWNVDTEDWKKPGTDTILKTIRNQLKPGGVVLLHSTHKETVEALPAIIRELKRSNCQFVTMSEWISRVLVS